MASFITGIAGFLGSHLADYLLARGHEVSGCDDLSSGVLDNVPTSAHVEIIDITKVTEISNFIQGCDVVFHCAAAAYEGVSPFSPAFISHNIYTGSANIFSAAIKAGVRRIVNCSSMARYGISTPPFFESFRCQPVDPYGLAKYSAEKLLEMLSETHGIEYAIAVPHSIYGPRQNYWTPYRNVIAIMINRMLQGKQPIIYGEGNSVRCFSYVDDIVPCLAKMADHDYQSFPIINLGPDNEDVKIIDLARMLAEIIKIPFDPIFMPPRPREVEHATCLASIARKALDFKPTVALKEGLIRQIEWIKSKGTKKFEYDNVPVEITKGCPKTWTERLV